MNQRPRLTRCGAAVVAAVLCTVALVAGCSSEESAGQATAAGPASDPPASSPADVPAPACPNPEGGFCVGRLAARTVYTTRLMTPQVTYRVPTRGWFNYEDYPGGLLLVPPHNTLAGVNLQTSDFLGVATAVTPARVVDLHGCFMEPLPGDWTPSRVAAWFRRQPNLDASTPVPATVGGLRGVVIDLRTKPGSHLIPCTFSGQRFPIAGPFMGIGRTHLEHALIPGMTMRLFLLSYRGNVLDIELSDIDDAPTSMATLTVVARHLKFGS